MSVSALIDVTIDQNQANQIQSSGIQGGFQTNQTADQHRAAAQSDPVLPSDNSKKQVSKLVNDANRILLPVPTNLHYVFYDKLNTYYVQIENAVTHEVIQEIPPKKMLDFAAAIAEKLGLIINHRI